MAQLICRQFFGLKKFNAIVPTAISRPVSRTFATEADPEDYGYCMFFKIFILKIFELL